ncbi:aminotransferase class I/II-fold pyridoxal phosphate-dependent enzyme [Cupriavidus basilensis]
MVDAIGKLPKQSIVLLHACCHNPTGVDLNQDQWRQLIGVLKAKELLPFVDMAYQGFGEGLRTKTRSRSANWNARACRAWWPTSFSKNFSLYGERCGGLSVVCNSADEAANVLGQLTGAVRANYSNPPHARRARGGQGADHARAAHTVGAGTGRDVQPHHPHARGHPPQSARPRQR